MIVVHSLTTHRIIELSTGLAAMAAMIAWFYLSTRTAARHRRLQGELRYLAAIVESSEDAIIGKDSFGIVTSWNLGAENIFGYTRSEMIGESIKRLLPPDRLAEEDEILARILRDEKVDHFNTTRITRSGRKIHVLLTISPIKDKHGKVIGASKIARDTTATRKLEEQLRHSQKMDAIGQLSSGIAHDFSNVLGIVIANLDILEQLTLDDEARRYVETALRAGLRGASLSHRLLAFSREESLIAETLLLDATIIDIVHMARRILGPEIVIGTLFNLSVPPVCVDPARLETSLLNLLTNARDAMPAGGSIRIATRIAHLDDRFSPSASPGSQTQTFACISVSDNGHGMTQETVDHAFEPFFTTKESGRGTGLGLAMVYDFVHQSGGSVDIYSAPGYGTTVSLYLPLATEMFPAEDLPAPQLYPVYIGSTVLIVDDELDLIDPAVDYLTDMGYTILRSNDSLGALATLAAHPAIDVMVTDILMPGGMNGIELAELVQQRHPRIKILISSGFPYDALAHKNLVLDENQLIQKPYRLAELGDAIHRLLDEREFSAAI